MSIALTRGEVGMVTRTSDLDELEVMARSDVDSMVVARNLDALGWGGVARWEKASSSEAKVSEKDKEGPVVERMEQE